MVHFDIEEKIKIIQEEVSSGCVDNGIARNIAQATDTFTFQMLKELGRAISIIAKGRVRS